MTPFTISTLIFILTSLLSIAAFIVAYIVNRRLQVVKQLLQERQQRLRGYKLTENQVEDIEMTVSKDTVAEVRQLEGAILVTRRPAKEHDIQLPFPMQCAEDTPCRLTMTLQKPGDVPVALGIFDLPANYWLEAIKGYRKQ